MSTISAFQKSVLTRTFKFYMVIIVNACRSMISIKGKNYEKQDCAIRCAILANEMYIYVEHYYGVQNFIRKNNISMAHLTGQPVENMQLCVLGAP